MFGSSVPCRLLQLCPFVKSGYSSLKILFGGLSCSGTATTRVGHRVAFVIISSSYVTLKCSHCSKAYQLLCSFREQTENFTHCFCNRLYYRPPKMWIKVGCTTNSLLIVARPKKHRIHAYSSTKIPVGLQQNAQRVISIQ